MKKKKETDHGILLLQVGLADGELFKPVFEDRDAVEARAQLQRHAVFLSKVTGESADKCWQRLSSGGDQGDTE